MQAPIHKLDERQKRYVLHRLAHFDTPQEVVQAVREEYGVSITRQTVEHYDPQKNPNLPLKHRQTFEAARAHFLKDEAARPIGLLVFRQEQRLKMLRQFERNPKVRMQLLNDAAKDEGGLFIHKRKSTGEDSKSVDSENLAFEDMRIRDLKPEHARSLPTHVLDALMLKAAAEMGVLPDEVADCLPDSPLKRSLPRGAPSSP